MNPEVELNVEPDLDQLDQLMDSVAGKELEPVTEVEEPVSSPVEDQLTALEKFYQLRVERVKGTLEGKGITSAQVEELKKRYGNVYTFAPTDTDLYLWRPLYKKEWDRIQLKFRNMQGPPEEKEPKIMETVVKQCTLYPKIDDAFLLQSRAGLLNSLFEVVMAGSFFYSAEQSLQLIVEL